MLAKPREIPIEPMVQFACQLNTINPVHVLNGTNSPSPLPNAGSQALNTGTFSWGNLSSDSTPNTAAFSGGTFAASDWGGQGTFTSFDIDVSSYTTADIAGQFGGSFNNAPDEFSNFFYRLDGGAVMTFGVGLEMASYTDELVGVSALDVSSASTLVVGFDFNHNGSADSFSVGSLTVNATAVPEPCSLLALGLCGVASIVRRRMKKRP